MSVIKSYSAGNGDMFYIDHNSDNLTLIDCCIQDSNKRRVLNEIGALCELKGIVRFISTHPDEDHIRGLEYLDDRIGIRNFYCVQNNVTKKDMTDSFLRYCALRDSAEKQFHIYKGCKRRWMNESNSERGTAGINILWPDTKSWAFKEALLLAELGGSPNNISPVIKYSLENGPTVLWMGDLESEFLEDIASELTLPRVDLLFAPHHGRDSGKIPESLLRRMDPKLIVIGEAPSCYLNYYTGYNTITQNTAGDLLFECVAGRMHVYTEYFQYVPSLSDEGVERDGYSYAGTLQVG